jgi:hypothetical protein
LANDVTADQRVNPTRQSDVLDYDSRPIRQRRWPPWLGVYSGARIAWKSPHLYILVSKILQDCPRLCLTSIPEPNLPQCHRRWRTGCSARWDTSSCPLNMLSGGLGSHNVIPLMHRQSVQGPPLQGQKLSITLAEPLPRVGGRS